MANPKPEYTHSLVERKPQNGPKSANELRAASKKAAEKLSADAIYKKNELSDIHITKAQQIKEDFENRMNRYKEDAGFIVAQEPLIRPLPGETPVEFRKRQEKENTGVPKKINFANKAAQNVKNKIQIQADRAKRYGRQQAGKGAQAVLKSNPKLAKAVASANEQAKAVQDKVLKMQNSNFAKRLQMLRRKKAELVKQKIKDELKKKALQIATQVARSIALAVIEALATVITFVASLFVEIIIAVIVIVAIIVIIDETCNANSVTNAICSAAAEIAGWLSWIYGMF